MVEISMNVSYIDFKVVDLCFETHIFLQICWTTKVTTFIENKFEGVLFEGVLVGASFRVIVGTLFIKEFVVWPVDAVDDGSVSMDDGHAHLIMLDDSYTTLLIFII